MVLRVRKDSYAEEEDSRRREGRGQAQGRWIVRVVGSERKALQQRDDEGQVLFGMSTATVLMRL